MGAAALAIMASRSPTWVRQWWRRRSHPMLYREKEKVTTPTSNTNVLSIQEQVLVPSFRDLVLRWQEGVVNSCRGGVTKCRQSQEFDLRQTQGTGITRPVQPQANSRCNLCLHQLDLYVRQAAGDDWCGERQHVDPVSTDLHRNRRWAGLSLGGRGHSKT